MDDLLSLSTKYREFYAPTYAIRIGGQDLMRSLEVAVSQLEVDLQLGTLGRFGFTVPSSYKHDVRMFKTGSGDDLLEVLTFGAEVEICMGYGDFSNPRSAPVIFRGIITELSTNFPDGGSPELTVGGFDHGYPMTMGKGSRTWTGQTDSTVAKDIASYNSIGSVIDPLTEKRPQTEQNQESDWEFLKKLADRSYYELFVDEEKQMHFTKPNDDADPIVELAYGEGLLNFKPEAKLSGQVSKVEIYGWNPKTRERIIGTATTGEESGLSGTSAGQILNNFIREPAKRPTLRVRKPVFTQSEADQLAEAELNARAKNFVTGEGETTGIPEIRPDRRVLLTKLGEKFSKAYYIQQAVHKIDGNGYRTRFKVGDPDFKRENA